jgi:hypothetical protein
MMHWTLRILLVGLYGLTASQVSAQSSAQSAKYAATVLSALLPQNLAQGQCNYCQWRQTSTIAQADSTLHEMWYNAQSVVQSGVLYFYAAHKDAAVMALKPLKQVKAVATPKTGLTDFPVCPIGFYLSNLAEAQISESKDSIVIVFDISTTNVLDSTQRKELHTIVLHKTSDALALIAVDVKDEAEGDYTKTFAFYQCTVMQEKKLDSLVKLGIDGALDKLILHYTQNLHYSLQNRKL